MIGVDACAVATQMVDDKPVRNLPNHHFVGYSVSHPLFTVNRQSSVSIPHDLPEPHPAAISKPHIGDEAIQYIFACAQNASRPSVAV